MAIGHRKGKFFILLLDLSAITVSNSEDDLKKVKVNADAEKFISFFYSKY